MAKAIDGGRKPGGRKGKVIARSSLNVDPLLRKRVSIVAPLVRPDIKRPGPTTAQLQVRLFDGDLASCDCTEGKTQVMSLSKEGGEPGGCISLSNVRIELESIRIEGADLHVPNWNSEIGVQVTGGVALPPTPIAPIPFGPDGNAIFDPPLVIYDAPGGLCGLLCPGWPLTFFAHVEGFTADGALLMTDHVEIDIINCPTLLPFPDPTVQYCRITVEVTDPVLPWGSNKAWFWFKLRVVSTC